jgi:hypothetical protein
MMSFSDAFHFLAAAWQAVDYSIPASWFMRPGFGSGIVWGVRIHKNTNPLHEKASTRSSSFVLSFKDMSLYDHVMACGKQSTEDM